MFQSNTPQMAGGAVCAGITKIADVPRRLADIDNSLGALHSRIEDLGIKISPALREADSCNPNPSPPTLPPTASQLEAALYSFNQRIENAIAHINHLYERIAL